MNSRYPHKRKPVFYKIQKRKFYLYQPPSMYNFPSTNTVHPASSHFPSAKTSRTHPYPRLTDLLPQDSSTCLPARPKRVSSDSRPPPCSERPSCNCNVVSIHRDQSTFLPLTCREGYVALRALWP